MNTLEKARAKVQTAFAKTVNGKFGLEYTPEQLNELKGLWANAVRQASENVQSGNVQNGESAQRSDIKYSFNVTQGDIDNYVEAAYLGENNEDYKKYAYTSERLIHDISADIQDISDYSHALRDNDIRHIRNSHGEGNTNEKYPITKDDIKKIPDITQNYDKVIYYPRGNKQGIMYVKTMSNGLVYYLEQATTKYGNEKLLINKQMIKTGMNDIPTLPGLKDSITKKQSLTEFLNDLNKAQQVYAQSVYQSNSASDNIISDTPPTVNTQTEVRNSIKEHDGARAKSQWTKDAIIEAAREIDSEKADMLQGVSATALKNRLLKQTDKLGGTKLYSFDKNALLTLTDLSEMEKLTPHSKSIRAVTQEAIRNLNNTQGETGRYSTEWNAKDIEEAVEGTQKETSSSFV